MNTLNYQMKYWEAVGATKLVRGEAMKIMAYLRAHVWPIMHDWWDNVAWYSECIGTFMTPEVIFGGGDRPNIKVIDQVRQPDKFMV
jgi:hypothetical protein